MFWLFAAATQADTPLRVGIAQAPITLDPRFATDAASERICHLIYRKLVDFDEHYQPVPQLADWEQLSPTHYRFSLREQGREFHDGSALTAADVKATYDFVLDPVNGSPHRGSLAVLSRVEVVDARHVDFFLVTADALFPGRLTLGIVPAARQHDAATLARQPLGSGPFRLEAWPDSSRLVLRRSRDQALLSFDVVPNPTVRALKLVRGEIDLLQGDMPPELQAWLRRQGSLVAMQVPGDGVAYIGFNMQDAATAKPQVRAAIAHAIDRDAIIRYVFKGAAQPAASVLLPSHWAGNAQLRVPGFDPSRARALLAAAGYAATHPLKLVYKTSSDPFRIRLATILQSQLRDVGIEVELRSHDFGTFYGDIKAGRFQMYTLSWVGLKLPDIFRYAFHSESTPPAGANRGRLNDATLDALIAAAEAQTLPAAQAEAYRSVQQRLLELLPIIPLWSEAVTAIARPRLHGYRPAADGSYDSLATSTW